MDLRFGFETDRHHGGNMFKCNKKAWIKKIMVKWLEKCLGQKTRCSSKAYRNADFICFQGSLKREYENCNI